MYTRAFMPLSLSVWRISDKTHQLVVLPGAAEAETKILQLCLDMVQAEAVRQRGVEIVGFAGYLHLLVGAHARQGTHIVQTVGELHQNRANVVLHGVEHLLEVVELPRHFVLFLFLLCDHAHEKCHVVAEALPYVVDCVVGILHHVVEECRNHKVCFQRQLLSRYRSYRYRVQDIRLAGFAPLRRMSTARQLEGRLYSLHIAGRHAPLHCRKHGSGTFIDDSVVILLFHGV